MIWKGAENENKKVFTLIAGICGIISGITHDYTRKGGVVHTELLLPDHAPTEYADRAVLWNAVEKIEKAKNAQLAREIEIALPKELTSGANPQECLQYSERRKRQRTADKET